MDKQNVVLMGPFVGEFYWEAGRFDPMLPSMRTKEFKNRDVQYIIFTRFERFDLYGKDEENNNILNRDSTHYTLQFFSMKNEPNAIRGVKILRTHNLGDQAIRYSYTSASGQWHKVIYGDYANIQDAKDMLQSIPEDSQILKPWIRNISTIQNDIRMSSSE